MCHIYSFYSPLQRSIELNPKDATSLHILGYWCFAFAELPWYQRKVAAVIFSKPPTSTFEEALEFFLKAEEGRTDCTETTEAITELLLLSLAKIRCKMKVFVG
ncbi:hypothetical protein GOODEAATRI_010406 [Goodea atripinnis]|uniref:Uncharacterized protein n=1 Tax=Goodea atripinnis TaxID=208336 RepID=A0ABV0PXD3_9TELE